MKKPASLRAALEASSAWLKKRPDHLLMFADEGRITARYSDTSYVIAYTLNIIITDFPEDHATVYVPLIAWLAVNQPDALLNHERGDRLIRFIADFLNHNTCDLTLDIDLTETVVVTTTEGATSATYVDEPPLDPYHDVTAWEEVFVKPETAPDWTEPDPTPT